MGVVAPGDAHADQHFYRPPEDTSPISHGGARRMSTHPRTLERQQAENEVDRLRSELARQQRNMRVLREIALVSRGAVEPRDVFQAIYDRLAQALPVDAFFVAICDQPDSPEYHFALFIDEGRHIAAADKLVGGLTGWILELKQGRLFRDLHREIDPAAPLPEQFGNTSRRSRAWIGVPLLIGRESMGVLSIQSYEYGVYDESDLQLVEALADLAAISIENAVLYRTQDALSRSLADRVAARSEELAVLTAIAGGLSRGEYDEVRLTEAIERFLWMLNLDAGAIWLEEAGAELRCAAAYATEAGAGAPMFDAGNPPRPDTLVRRVLQQHAAIIGSSEEIDEVKRSVFALPLQAHGRIIGVLALYGEVGRQLAPHEVSLLEAASQQIAIGVENARLYRRARDAAAVAERRADNLTLVHRISRLVSSSLDAREIVRIAAEQMVALFDVDHCAIMLFDERGLRGEVAAEYPSLATIGLHARFLPGDFLEAEPGRGEPALIVDIAHDPRVRAVRDAALRADVRAILLVPLVARGRSIGAISLNLIKRTREFSDEERELCRTVAAHVATALENAGLYHVSVTRVEQEMEIARSIQANLFPRELPHIPGAMLAGYCLPARETGGDFYDVLPLGDDRFGFSVGDVSGKSLPAAMLMAVARSVVRSEAIDHVMPERVVTETNRLIDQDVPANTFVALCYAVYESTTRRLAVATGGQITPFLRRANGTVEFLSVVNNLPLGIIADTQYESRGFDLAPGESVLFLTDGLVEAFSPGGEMYGFERLAELFGRCGDLPARQVVDTLMNTIVDWQPDDDRTDDMTALVLQVL